MQIRAFRRLMDANHKLRGWHRCGPRELETPMSPASGTEASWLRNFRSAEERRDWDAVRDLRAEVSQATAEVVCARRYQSRTPWVHLDAEGSTNRSTGGLSSTKAPTG